MTSHRPVYCLLALLILAIPLLPEAQTRNLRAIFMPYADAQPILRQFGERLPAGLRNRTAEETERIWPQWAAAHDAEVRARLEQGEEDSLVNFLLFGTTFTQQPRVTEKDLAVAQPGAQEMTALVGRIILARLDDLVRGLAAPRDNERLLFLRRLVERKGYRPDSDAGRRRLSEYVLLNLRRVLNEQKSHAGIISQARRGDATAVFAERSRLYRDRGISLDTTLLPNLAIEESLRAMQARGLLSKAEVRRVAIIGPGMDFTDKAAGHDFYPEQTIQPFALVDSLLRLGLARAGDLRVITLDLSSRVNDHLTRSRERARRGVGYVVQLPHDRQAQWKVEVTRYWERFGDEVGRPAAPVAVPQGAGDLQMRAVRIRPAIVSLIRPADLNIVVQRLDPGAEFDLIVATNIFIYYDLFEQSLALANVGHMLRPGGFLLSNNALPELPGALVHSAGYLNTVYSDRPDDGDHIVWYQKGAPG